MITILKTRVTKLTIILFVLCVVGFSLNDHFVLKRGWVEAVLTTTICFLIGFSISIIIETIVSKISRKG